MKPLSRILASTLLLGIAGNTVAASSVDLTVKGLITPNACEPTLSNGGVFDYGKISVKDLAPPAQPTALEKRTMAINITCAAATLAGLQGKDNRAGSDLGDGRYYGMGLVNGTEKLGDYFLRLQNLTADGAPMRSIKSEDNGATWQASQIMRPNFLMSVADDTTVAPVAFQVLSGEIEIEPYIAPTENLTLDKELPMDGSATFTVRYL